MTDQINKGSRIVFVSEFCLLDRKSGAAQSVRAMLMALANAGWQCQSITMNKFDGEQEYLNWGDQQLDQKLMKPGQWFDISDEPLRHHVMATHSTQASRIRPWDIQAFLEKSEHLLNEIQPTLVLTFGSEHLRPLWAHAQGLGAQTIFYLANASYAQSKAYNFQGIDEFLVPSLASAKLYKDSLGLETKVLRNMVQAPFDGRLNLQAQRWMSRKQRFITMINPEPAKGGLLFLNVAAQLHKQAPDLKCRVIESRWGREHWHREGVDVDMLTNLEWHPFTHDMKRVYEETALLLVPSLWFEASGRVIAEAMQAGIPVMAMNSGGIAEQLNNGGFLFEVPDSMRKNFAAAPPADVLNQWTQFVLVLMNNDAVYQRAVQLALQAGQTHDLSLREKQAVKVFELLKDKPLNNLQDVKAAQELNEVRQRMDRLREAINRKMESTDGLATMPELAADEAQEPYAEVLKLSMAQSAIQQGLLALREGAVGEARVVLDVYLRHVPTDLVALGLLATIAHKEGNEKKALLLLERLLELAPGFGQAQVQFLQYAKDSKDTEKALQLSEKLMKRASHQRRYAALHASLLVASQRFEEAIEVYAPLLSNGYGRSQDWMQYGLALKTLGHQQQSVDAYRKAIEKAPQRGASWHGLSNTKLAVFTEEDISNMKSQLDKELPEDDQLNIHFTLGKAYEDRCAYEHSFKHYAQANAIRRGQSKFDVGIVESSVKMVKEVLTAEFFQARQGQGCPSQAPIFVLGMHRAGSTLTEQILASHSQIEGTRELPYMVSIGRAFGGFSSGEQSHHFLEKLVNDLEADEWAQLGQSYLDNCWVERHTQRPLFVDKMPANWMYAGLIHLMLPNAKIIDVRRAPMSAGFALFKMNFGRGVDYSNSQEDIARYYLAYTDLMAHLDAVLPGRIHHLSYENLVENTDVEIRRLIDYCGLPFEEKCLRYWETERAVQTPSSEQVRKPIYKEAMAQWKNYEPWLGPMKAKFGLSDDVDALGTRI